MTALNGYNYYGYVSSGSGADKKHTWIIQRSNVAGTEYRYSVGTSVRTTYSAAWTDKENLPYSRLDQIKQG